VRGAFPFDGDFREDDPKNVAFFIPARPGRSPAGGHNDFGRLFQNHRRPTHIPDLRRAASRRTACRNAPHACASSVQHGVENIFPWSAVSVCAEAWSKLRLAFRVRGSDPPAFLQGATFLNSHLSSCTPARFTCQSGASKIRHLGIKHAAGMPLRRLEVRSNI